MITIEVDNISREYVERKLGDMKAKAPVVIARGLNKTAISARMRLSSGIRERYIVKSGAAKSDMRIKRANAGNLQAEIISRGNTIKLEKFRVSAPPSGAKGKVLRNSGLKALINSQGNKAFAAGMKAGQSGNIHNGIYQRRGKSRLPIKSFHGPSIPKMIETVYDGKRVGRALKPKIKSDLKKNINYQIKRLVG